MQLFHQGRKSNQRLEEGLILALLFPGFVLLGKFLHVSEPLVSIFIKWGDNDNTKPHGILGRIK